MKTYLARATGFLMMFAGLLFMGWCSTKVYDAFYGGTPYRVVMPHGAAGVTPGGAVKYRGIDVGVVRSVRPLLQEQAEVRRAAHRTYLRSRTRLQQGAPPQTKEQVWGLDQNGQEAAADPYPPAGMALVRILLRDPSVPVGNSTFAGGSAYYMTGQGYVTLSNDTSFSDEAVRPAFIPSTVEQFWQDRYLDILLRFVPVFEGGARFQKKFRNWYFKNDHSDDGSSVSGRQQLRNVSTILNEQETVSETIKSGVREAGEPLDRAASTLDRANRQIQGFAEAIDEMQSSASVHASSGSPSTDASDGRTGVFIAEHDLLESIRRTVRWLLNAVDDDFERILQRGLLDDMQQ